MEMGQSAGQTWIEKCGKCGRNQHQHPNMCPAVKNYVVAVAENVTFCEFVVNSKNARDVAVTVTVTAASSS